MNIKESVLVVGGDSVGKSTALLDIARQHPERKVVLIDFENKVAKLLMTEFNDITIEKNFTIEEWSDVEEAVDYCRNNLGIGDWLLIDGLDAAWDLAQAAYEDSDKKTDQWQWIKKRHNKEFVDYVCSRAKFNVAATAWSVPNSDFNIDRESDAEVKEDLMLWKQFGFKPGGEKRNTRRFDTVFALKGSVNPVRFYAATYKDKGREYIDNGTKGLWREYKGSLWNLYRETQEQAIASGKNFLLVE